MESYNVLYEQYRKEMDRLNMSQFEFECTETANFYKELYMPFAELEEQNLLETFKTKDAQGYAFKFHREFGKYPVGITPVEVTQKVLLGSYTRVLVEKCLPRTISEIANSYNEHAELLKTDIHAYAYVSSKGNGKVPGNIKTAPVLQGKLKEMEICLLCNMSKDELMLNGGLERLYELDKDAANAKLAA